MYMKELRGVVVYIVPFVNISACQQLSEFRIEMNLYDNNY